jgi:hypothetical protein
VLRGAIALTLGAGAATIAACGSSGGGGLIPASLGGPLHGDVEAVERAAESGNGDCTATEAALTKTKIDYGALPSSVNAELRSKIHIGIENLQKVATEACAQQLLQTKTATTPKTTSTASTETQTTPPTTSSTTTTTKPPAEEEEHLPGGAGGGTPAPGETERPPSEGAGGSAPEEDHGNGNGNGNGAANGAGGSEGSK